MEKLFTADAWTAQLLPLTDSVWAAYRKKITDSSSAAKQKEAVRLAAASARLKQDKLLHASRLPQSDPLERLSWLTSSPLPRSTPSSVAAQLASGHALDYTSELYGGTVLYIWQAVGLHRWSSGTNYGAFASTESDMIRYLPLQGAVDCGSFYRF